MPLVHLTSKTLCPSASSALLLSLHRQNKADMIRQSFQATSRHVCMNCCSVSCQPLTAAMLHLFEQVPALLLSSSRSLPLGQLDRAAARCNPARKPSARRVPQLSMIPCNPYITYSLCHQMSFCTRLISSKMKVLKAASMATMLPFSATNIHTKS